MKEAIGTILRLILKAGGGALAAKGVMDEGAVETIIGAIITIFGAVWGVIEAKKAAQLRRDGQPTSNIAGPLLVLVLALGLSGCVTEKRMEAGGPYAASVTQAAQSEIFVLDSAFDLAYSALDSTFKYERDNRALLWKLSPDIKRTMDKLRKEAGTVRDDYALARTVYLENPTPAGLDELQSALNKLQGANIAALNVIETKGKQ